MEAYAASIESLGLKKQTDPFLLEKDTWFYKYKDDTILPYYKEDIWKVVNVFKPNTFLPILKELDMPFIENQWLILIKTALIKRVDGNLAKNVLGKYISWCKLKGNKWMTFEDSDRRFFGGYDYNYFHYLPLVQFGISYSKEDNNYVDH